MKPQITFAIVDHDPDYLGLEIRMSNDRYSATTRIYADNSQLTEFCDVIEGFPKGYNDAREYTFGTKDAGFTGGYCKFYFRCNSATGSSTITTEVKDDETHHDTASATFNIVILPAELDNFIRKLKNLESKRSGQASLN